MMPEILTESFCERCGTRYTFESAAPRKTRRIGAIKTLSKGMKNWVLSDDQSLDEAMAAARNDEERALTSQQLDAFHSTFNFCMTCRQYTCGNCWNTAEGRCLTCAPHLGHEMMPAAFSDAAPVDAVRLETQAWPEIDLGAAGGPNGNGHGRDDGSVGADDTLDAWGEAGASSMDDLPEFDAAARLAFLSGESPALGVDSAPTAGEDEAGVWVEAEPAVAEHADVATAEAVDPGVAAAPDAVAEQVETPTGEVSVEGEPIHAAHAAGGEPIESIAELIPAVAEPVDSDEPMPGVAEPVDAAAEPTEAVAHAAAPADAAQAVVEPVDSVDPVEAVAEPVEAVAQPAEAVAEPAPPAQPAADAPAPASLGFRLPVVDPSAEAFPRSVEDKATVGSARTSDLLRRFRPGQNIDAELAAYEASLAPSTPVAEPASSESPSSEPVSAPSAASADVEADRPRVAEIELEPADVEAEPVAPRAEASATAQLQSVEAVAIEADAAGPALEPDPTEPEPVAADPASSADSAHADRIEQPTWRIYAPDRTATQGPMPDESAEPAAPRIAATGDPQWPARPDTTDSPAMNLLANRANRGPSDGLWAASAQEVLAPVTGAAVPTAGVQPCSNCGLSLSANARFCRRCGTRQG